MRCVTDSLKPLLKAIFLIILHNNDFEILGSIAKLLADQQYLETLVKKDGNKELSNMSKKTLVDSMPPRRLSSNRLSRAKSNNNNNNNNNNGDTNLEKDFVEKIEQKLVPEANKKDAEVTGFVNNQVGTTTGRENVKNVTNDVENKLNETAATSSKPPTINPEAKNKEVNAKDKINVEKDDRSGSEADKKTPEAPKPEKKIPFLVNIVHKYYSQNSGQENNVSGNSHFLRC